MRVGVVGSQGFVGNAVKALLERCPEIDLVEYDTGAKTGNPVGSIAEIDTCEVAFVCVPTPMKSDGSCNLEKVGSVIAQINPGIIVIKSTVPPGTTTMFARRYGKHIVHNPEFLREASAVEDMLNADRVVLGGNKEDCEKVKLVYQMAYQRYLPYIICDSETSELSKYAINTYLSAKVIFFNELKEIADSIGVDFEFLRSIVLLDDRIGESHTVVTKEGGFGGHCFPKDLNALISFAYLRRIIPSFLIAVWNCNRKYRMEFSGKEFDFYGE